MSFLLYLFRLFLLLQFRNWLLRRYLRAFLYCQYLFRRQLLRCLY